MSGIALTTSLTRCWFDVIDNFLWTLWSVPRDTDPPTPFPHTVNSLDDHLKIKRK